MERTMRTMTDLGVTWTYRRGFVYSGEYRGYSITIRRAGARTASTRTPWRLYVSRGQGGSLAFHHQFWPTAEDARREGVRLVDEAVC
jgi:hypothetical protein